MTGHQAEGQEERSLLPPPQQSLLSLQVGGDLLALSISVPEAGLDIHSGHTATCLAVDMSLELWIQDGHLELTEPEAEVAVTRGLCSLRP